MISQEESNSRLVQMKKAMADGDLPHYLNEDAKVVVKPIEFIEWAESVGWTLPEELVKKVKEHAQTLEEGAHDE